MTQICVSNLTTTGSDNGLSPSRRQAIIWTNAGILLIGPLGTNFSEILIEIHTFSFKKMHLKIGTNFSEILIEIHTFSFKKMHLKMSSGKWRPFCVSLNVLTSHVRGTWCGWWLILLCCVIMHCDLMGEMSSPWSSPWARDQFMWTIKLWRECWHKVGVFSVSVRSGNVGEVRSGWI